MPRRKAKRSRRRKTFSILNGLEALAYASILSEGVTGGSLAAFITGAGDLGTKTLTTSDLGIGMRGTQTLATTTVGAGQISLADIVQEPSLALQTMSNNFQANLFPMAFAAFSTSVGFSVGRKLLRKPLSNITRNIIHPVLGKGVRM